MIKSAWITLVAACLLALTPAAAQNFGEITGTVTDPSGAVIAGAAVTVTNEATGVARTAETNESGSYNVPFLNPGVYTITAALDGFRTARIAGRVIQIGDVAQVNFTLEIGVVTEVVEVEAGAQMLATSNTAVGTVIDNERIVELPINGRNYLNLVKLSPNVSAEMQSGGQANSRQGGERANQSISIAGQRQQFNRYSLDGMENTDPNFNTFIIRPSVDAIQEFKVQTGVYSAEYGKASSQVIVTTKSGTNEFHGTVYEFLRNDKIQANSWQRLDRPPFRRNQFGTTVTGPVVKNRVFFMANYEGLRQSVQDFGQAIVAPVSMRNGDFTNSRRNIFDPISIMQTAPGKFTATQFTNNIIPTNRLSPTSKKLLEFYDEPTLPTGIDQGINFQRNVLNTSDWDQFTTRGDVVENDSSQWFYRYSWGGESTLNGGTLPITDTRIQTDVQQHLLSNTRTFSPTLVNELRLGVSLFDNDLLTKLNGIRDVSSELGIPGMPTPSLVAAGTPRINVGGNNDFSGWGESTEGPFVNRNRNFQIVNNTSWIRGNHTIKFGVDISESRFQQVGNQFARGEFNTSNIQTADPNNRGTTGNGFAGFMTGWFNQATRAGGLPNVQFRRKPMMFYLEDTWKVTPKLTMNIGLRYENTPPWHDKHSGFMNLSLECPGVDDTGIDESCPVPTLVRPAGVNDDPFEGLAFHLADIVPVAKGDDILHSRRLVKWDTNDFAPRLGISYAPDANTTVRLGYGWFYAQDTANPVFDMARNFGARDDAFSIDEIPEVNFEQGPWANKAPGACAGWSGTCLSQLYTFGNDSGRITPNIQQWVLNVQRQVTDTLMFEVGYMGSAGHNLQKMHGWNQPLLRSGPGDNSSAIQRRPWGEAYGVLQTISSMANSNYHALGAKMLQRNANGLTYLLGYTWAKSIDDSSAIRVNGGDNLFPINFYDWSNERGLSQFHTAHRLTASILYDLPLRFDNGLAEALAGGWQIGSIFTFSSGTPRGQGGCPGNPTAGANGGPDATGINPNYSEKTAEAYWTKGANGLSNSFSCGGFIPGETPDPTFPYRYGNSTRNSLIGPGVANMDFSATKNFRINESMGVEFKFESYNATNHPNWDPPSTAINNPQFGRVTSARDMRINQFALKFNF